MARRCARFHRRVMRPTFAATLAPSSGWGQEGNVRDESGARQPGDVSGGPDPFAPAQLGPIQLRNRFIKAATFEGMAVDNLVTDRLIDFHRAMAAGGLGMTTLAYLAV